jgi:hypothetical protein
VKVLILATFDLGHYVYAAREVLRELARPPAAPGENATRRPSRS